MLASRYRLKQPRDITRVFKRGRHGGGGELLVKAGPNGMAYSRLVVIVSKKVSKKAVVRNRIRRRISGIVEAVWQTVSPGYDIVITVRDDVAEMPAKTLEDKVQDALKRSGVRA
jgi:ribonuclease P protein component